MPAVALASVPVPVVLEKPGFATPAAPNPAPPAGVKAGKQTATVKPDNRLGEMITIPAVPFLMGNGGPQKSEGPEEFPQHAVNLPACQIGKYPVTRGQYRTLLRLYSPDESAKLLSVNQAQKTIMLQLATAKKSGNTLIFKRATLLFLIVSLPGLIFAGDIVERTAALVSAVRNGADGATIEIAAGTFELEAPLEPKTGMTRKGAGIDRTIITHAVSTCVCRINGRVLHDGPLPGHAAGKVLLFLGSSYHPNCFHQVSIRSGAANAN